MPLSITPNRTNTPPSWSDSGTNVLRLEQLKGRNGQLVSNAMVTATVSALTGPTTFGPVTLPPVSGEPGAYEALVTDARFQRDTVIKVTYIADLPDGRRGVFELRMPVVA